MVPPVAPSRMVGRLANSSTSGIFFQGDGQSQVVTNSYLTSAFGNCRNSVAVTGRSSLLIGSGDMNNAVLNNVANSGPNVAASSLVTDANSALSGGPHLRRSASINTDTYMRLPASPMSYSSNQISISGSSIMDGSSAVQQVSHQSPSSHQVHQSQQHHQGASSTASLPTSQMGQVSLPTGPYAQGSFIQDPNHLSQVQKKPRLDIKQEDIQQQQAIQHLLQRQDPVQLHPLQALIQQQRFRQQQQQILQSMPPIQLAHLQQQQKMQLRHHLPQQGMQPVTSTVKRPFDAGICARRLMQYLYHQRQRPPDSSIAYWRKFVGEYYSPRAKKRWCLSLYDNVGQHALGVFPQAAMDAWQCDVCKSKSGRGFEATFEVLPRLYEIKFSTGVIDELLFLDLPHESRFPSGIMVLEYAKAVQESVYEQLRVVREGRLRITFTPDLKILNWEFCARRHEELLPRRFVAPQVSQLVHAALKCQSTIPESGSDGTSQQDLHSNSNMVLAAGHQLAKSLELQSLNDLGFSKRYVRCLQIAEVVNSMKDLINFCKDNKAGPIEGLKNYPRHASEAKLQMQKMQEMEQLASIQGLPTDRSTLNKLLTLHPGMNQNGHIFNNQHINRGSLGGYAQASLALTNNQNLLTRQNSNPNSHQVEAFSSFSRCSDRSPSTSYQGQGQSALKQGSGPNLHCSGFSSPSHSQPQQQQQQQQPEQQRILNATNGTHPQAPQGGGQALQQHMIQQLLQEMHSSSTGQAFSGQTVNGSVARGNGVGFGNSTTAAASASSPNVPGGVVGPASSRSSSFKAASNSDSSPAGGINNNVFNPKSQDLPQSLRLSEEMVQDIAHDFADNGFFNGDLDDSLSYVWKD